jgi:alkylation response protein AidB-like acyl-CoA dehydrogenase
VRAGEGAEAAVERGQRAVERARAVAPVVADAAREIFALGRLPGAVVDALAGADLFRLTAPAAYGGAQCDPGSLAAVAQVIGRADMSAAWCIVQACGAAHSLGSRLDEETGREVFGTPGSVVAAGTAAGTARAEPVAGGYRVTGEWAFASGCQHAAWFDARALLYRDGQPVRTGTGIGALSTHLVPRGAVEVIESWDVVGMRGTGSHRYRVHDVFVPERFAVPLFGEPAGAARPPEYRIPTLGFIHLAFASVALGGAEAAIDEFFAVARGKRASMAPTPMRETAIAQAALARARGTVQAAVAHRDWAAGQVWAEACAGAVSPTARAGLRLAAVGAVEAAVAAIDSLYHVAGTTGIFEQAPLQRRFQDIHVLAQQLFARPSHYENVGKLLLGLDYDDALL